MEGIRGLDDDDHADCAEREQECSLTGCEGVVAGLVLLAQLFVAVEDFGVGARGSFRGVRLHGLEGPLVEW